MSILISYRRSMHRLLSARNLQFPLTLVVLLMTYTIAYSQVISLGDQVSRPLPGSGHDYIHGLAETVNPANGTLSIKIDLPTPKGRGLTLPLSITYNSGEMYNPISLQPGTSQDEFNTNRSFGGWSDTLPYATITYFAIPINEGPYYGNGPLCPMTSSYNFYDPTGASHQLGLAAIGPPSDFNSTPVPQAGCSNVPYGSGSYFYRAFPTGGDDQVYAQMDAICDGDAYNEVYPSDCMSAFPAFTVTDISGTIYSFPANTKSVWVNPSSTTPEVEVIFPAKIQDRNGNVIQFTIPSDSIPAGLPIVDTLGRHISAGGITSSTGAYFGLSSSYTVGGLTYTLGFNGTTDAKFSVGYKQIYPIPFPSGASCEFGLGGIGSTSGLFNTLTLPNGQAYTFEYNNIYGLISKITYPNGGWVSYTWGLSPNMSTIATYDALVSGSSPYSGGCNFEYQTPVITGREVGYDSSTSPAQTQVFSYTTGWDDSTGLWTSKTTKITTTDNITGLASETDYSYGSVYQLQSPNSGGQRRAQLPVEKTIKYFDWGQVKLLKAVTESWADQFEMRSQTTEWNNNPSATSITTYCYMGGDCSEANSLAGVSPSGLPDPSGFPQLLHEQDEYGYDGNLFRKTTSIYYAFQEPCQFTPPISFQTNPQQPCASAQNAQSVGIVGPCQTITYDGQGNPVAETDAYYDNQALCLDSNPVLTSAVASPLPLPTGTHDESNYGPTPPTHSLSMPLIGRGNLTKLVKWSSPTSSIATSFSYDETGQVISETDPCGNVTCSSMTDTNHTTTYSYSDYPVVENATTTSNAYVTTITKPSTNGTSHTSSYSYDYVTGELTSSTDENTQTTNYIYNDPLKRLKEIQGPPDPNNSGQRPTTMYKYDDAAPNPSVTTIQTVNTAGIIGTSVSAMDGMGHVTSTNLTSAAQGADHVDITVDTTYDGLGNVHTVSNPHASTDSVNLTTYNYDALGRKASQLDSDGLSKQMWTYNGNTVIYQDENGNQWKRTYDAFGDLTQVLEPSPPSPPLETDYTYNTLNNLLSVTQHGANGSIARVRTFNYDSLSRLLCASNPEYSNSSNPSAPCPLTTTGAYIPGTVGYSYDANGNLQSKTDTRNITTNYGYDALNRIISKVYINDASKTPISCFQYDTSPLASGKSLNLVGRLTNSWTQGNSATACSSAPTAGNYRSLHSILAYNPMGQAISEQQCTPSNCASLKPYSSQAKFDLAGNLTYYTNGITTTPGLNALLSFTSSYDGADRLLSVKSSWNDSLLHPSSIFSAQSPSSGPCGQRYSYAAFGGLLNATLGSNLTLSRSYDSRLRRTCETDTAGPLANRTGGSATITIIGAEQTK
ncbi:RHS repeat domain-containing protein [Acidicapsa ligni]|uniref:RHS repeat domain-containing protein n=1 Tax=Acidicapsa ligni TaxID=542300 RepID=UPI0021E0688C|nr:hypothetical protein [Acidicapsa ligni]